MKSGDDIIIERESKYNITMRVRKSNFTQRRAPLSLVNNFFKKSQIIVVFYLQFLFSANFTKNMEFKRYMRETRKPNETNQCWLTVVFSFIIIKCFNPDLFEFNFKVLSC
uniref:Uncharacterized protein n=1 Tax=Cacopsylla melanoneura TaxID=428564 RepID=A0A8D9EN42_9HEMI